MIRTRLAALALAGLLASASAAPAQEAPGDAARAAAGRLEAASRMLDSAQGADDRVAALTETVRAYEDGLVALRDGLRRAAVRQRAIEVELDARSDEVARLLGVLQTMGRAPAPLLLLHPTGPVGTARSGMIVADVTPALQSRVTELRARLEEVQTLRALQEDAAKTLREGLDGAQQARAALSEAMADRTDLPRRFTEDPVRTALLIASTETLGAFASGLTDSEAETTGEAPDATDRRGALPLPVQGRLLRRAGEADAAGVTRPGIVVATGPRAIVTTPAAATLRYKGPLLDYGTVAILEPAAGVLFVFAGLDEAYGEAGEILPEGSPVGLMGGAAPDAQAILTDSAAGAGATRPETLYIEVREEQETVDPAEWFVLE